MNDIRVLVATDIAARGIDIDQLPHVVNYELPNVPEDYVHRIGRTRRARQRGEAVSLVCVDEYKLLFDIEKFIKSKINKVHTEAFTPDPNIKAEPIQNGRGGGQKRGNGNGRKRSGNNNTSTQRNRKEHTAKKSTPKNAAAAQIGSDIQAKLDQIDKRDNRPARQRRR